MENNAVLESLGLQPNQTPPADNGGQSNEGGNASPLVIPEGFSPSVFGEGFDSWEKVQTEIPTRLGRMKELEQELEGYKSKPSTDFANPEIAEYNQFVRATGQSDYNLFDKVRKAENMDPLDLLVMKQVMENPAYKGKEELLKEELMDTYKVSEIYDPKQIELGNLRLQEEAKKAGDWLSELRGKLQVVAPDPKVAEELQAKRVEAWKKELDGLTAKVDKLAVPIQNGDKVVFLPEYTFKPEIIDRYKEVLEKSVSGMDVNDKTRGEIEMYLRNQLIVDQLPNLISHAVQLERTKIVEEMEAKYGGQLDRGKAPGGGSNNGEDFLDKAIRESRN